MAKCRTFTPEFKAKVALEVISGSQSAAKARRRYSPKPQVLSRWKAEFLDNAVRVFQSDEQRSQEQARIAELERLMGRQALELGMRMGMGMGMVPEPVIQRNLFVNALLSHCSSALQISSRNISETLLFEGKMPHLGVNQGWQTRQHFGPPTNNSYGHHRPGHPGIYDGRDQKDTSFRSGVTRVRSLLGAAPTPSPHMR